MTRRHRLVISPRARSDMQDIYQYTTYVFDQAQADKYFSRLEKSMIALLRDPKLGRERSDIKTGHRCLPVEKHLIFYSIRRNEIHILGVPHMRMDLINYFAAKSKR